MSRIDVVCHGDEFQVLVNFIQRGVTLHNAQFANQEAMKIKANDYPKAELHLYDLHGEGTVKLRRVK